MVMIGGLLKSTSRLAIVAAAGMFVGGLALTPAQAADLGGDCCADLEERVADLEATTARKGNRKVSLKISGHVARDIGWWEDSDGESEFYSAGHGPSGSRVQFSGSAKLTSSWTAGYNIRLRISDDRTGDTLDSAGENSDASFADFDKNYVYLSNKSFGTFAFGRTYAPTDGVSNISLAGRGVTGDSDGYNAWNNDNMQNSFFDLEQGLHQAIAYISPTIAGFTLSVAWADLDIANHADSEAVDAWDMALRYANEFGPIRVAAGIGYTVADNDNLNTGSHLMGSVALMHTPTGLNVAFGAGKEIDGGITGVGGVGNATTEGQFWHVEGGVSQNFFGPGNTSIYGEYGNYDTGVAGDDEATMWGLGIVQKFDSAATELYIAYRKWEDSDRGGNDGVAANDTGEASQIMAGMRIKF